jgi:hypothetical protein
MSDTNLLASSNQYTLGISCKEPNIIFNKVVQLNDGLINPLTVVNSISGQTVNLTYDPNVHSTLILCNTNVGNIQIDIGDFVDGQIVYIFRTSTSNALTVNFTGSTSASYYSSSSIGTITGSYAISSFGFWKFIYEKANKRWYFVQIVNA